MTVVEIDQMLENYKRLYVAADIPNAIEQAERMTFIKVCESAGALPREVEAAIGFVDPYVAATYLSELPTDSIEDGSDLQKLFAEFDEFVRDRPYLSE